MRITNVNEVDLSRFQFDYDLTMAFVLASPDGTVHHRYGGRDNISPMNLETLIDIMKRGVATHRDYLKDPKPPKELPPLKIGELVETQLKAQMKPTNGCYHCHYVREAKQYLDVRNRTWEPDQFWIYPSPERLGLVVDQQQQYRVARVIAESPAAKAGIAVGDHLQTLAGKRVLSKYDIQSILEASPATAMAMPFSLQRGNKRVAGHLNLTAAWKVGDPQEYDWRVNNIYTEHMRKYLPTPGLVGDLLAGESLAAIGLPSTGFALRVTHTNYGTHLSGIRRGDIILAAGGRSDFKSARDFYHSCELMRLAKRDISMDLLRHGTKMRLMVILGYASYTSVEASPEVMLGFIAQELAGDQGLRIGNVEDGCGAEQAGLRLGDRIVSVDGQNIRTFEGLQRHLDTRVPGDTIAFEIRRRDVVMRLAFSLVDKDRRVSQLAVLSASPRENGQEITCSITIELEDKHHVYSANKAGFGLPTKLRFRGKGFELVGAVVEPEPRAVREEGVETMWILEGKVELQQKIRITDAVNFELFLEVYAQVCDEATCHELRAVVEQSSGLKSFTEFTGRFEDQPRIKN